MSFEILNDDSNTIDSVIKKFIRQLSATLHSCGFTSRLDFKVKGYEEDLGLEP